jgi:hypothetical protein
MPVCKDSWAKSQKLTAVLSNEANVLLMNAVEKVRYGKIVRHTSMVGTDIGMQKDWRLSREGIKKRQKTAGGKKLPPALG